MHPNNQDKQTQETPFNQDTKKKPENNDELPIKLNFRFTQILWDLIFLCFSVRIHLLICT